MRPSRLKITSGTSATGTAEHTHPKRGAEGDTGGVARSLIPIKTLSHIFPKTLRPCNNSPGGLKLQISHIVICTAIILHDNATATDSNLMEG